jgi:PIN domain nuclease of toxin-antitoxin system
MAYLLDTHTFLWFTNDDKLLSEKARKAISDPSTSKYISIATFREIAIKLKIGKLQLETSFQGLREQLTLNGFQLLNIEFEHTNEVCTLELHHADPFDRIIVAQAMVEKLTVITKDKNIAKYTEVQTVW